MVHLMTFQRLILPPYSRFLSKITGIWHISLIFVQVRLSFYYRELLLTQVHDTNAL